MTSRHRAGAGLLLFLHCLGAAESGTAIPGSVVRVTVSDPARDLDLRSVAIRQNGPDARVIMSAHPRDGAGSQMLVTTVVDPSGRMSGLSELTARVGDADLSASSNNDPGLGTAFAVSEGREYLIVSGLKDARHLLQVGASAPGATIDFPALPEIRRLKSRPGGALLAVGSIGLRPMLMEFNPAGKITFDLPTADVSATVVNAHFEASGNIVVAGEQGIFPSATAWVARLAPKGNVLTHASYPGRPLDIAAGEDGSYLLIMEVGGARGSEIVCRKLGADLKEQWNLTLTSGELAITSYRAAGVPGGFIVAGMKARGLYVSRIALNGATLWTESHDPMKTGDLEITTRVDMAKSGDRIVIAYTAFVSAGREQRQVVRAILFRV